MSTFGIRTSEIGDSDEHYIAEDEILLEWLLANNYERSDRDSCYVVKAPEGYAFYRNSLFPKNSSALEGLIDEDVTDSSYVSFGSPENDKALMLLEEAMENVEPSDFYALDLEEDRILDYLIY